MGAVVCFTLVTAACDQPAADDTNVPLAPNFEALQSDLFGVSGGQPNAWADYDKDGDLDFFVGFRGRANRLYRNDRGTFVDVAGQVGLADEPETRAAAWGDYDGDGDLDLYVGFVADAGIPNRLYRNDAGGTAFIDVAAEVGIVASGTTRQPVFVDYDGDGDLDLFVAFRDAPNRLWRNDGGGFSDVTESTGLGDTRRTVGAVWFDIDGDADLDLFVANQEGDSDGVYRNTGDGTFTDVAVELGMDLAGRPADEGSVGVAVSDYDNDGDLDLFVATYGPDVLWQNQGDGSFVNVAPGTPLAESHHSVAADFGDFDNDGWVDLFVGTFLSGEPEAADRLMRNDAGTFTDVTPAVILEHGASHGAAWADYDADGDLDLALANNDAAVGTHPLYANRLPPDRAARSLAVVVLNPAGVWNRPGALVTINAVESEAPTSRRFVSSRQMGAGGGYSSQGAIPVHFGFPSWVTALTLSVSWFEGGERRTAEAAGIDPAAFRGQWLVIQLGT